MDMLTELLRYVLIILGSNHKERLGTGIAVGLVILFFHASFVAAEMLPAVPTLIAATGCIALGVILMFIPIWINPKKRLIGEDEQKILALMEVLSRRSGLSDVQKKLGYQIMFQKQIEHYRPGQRLELEKDAEASIAEAKLDNRED